MIEVGSGSYGSVYSNGDKKTVTKIFKEDVEIQSIICETSILFGLESDNLTKGIKFNDRNPKHNNCFSIEMEKCDGSITDEFHSSFNDFFKRSYSSRYAINKKLFKDYLLGIKCLNDHNYVHLDIAANNLMYTGDLDDISTLKGKIIDFGTSTKILRNKDGSVRPFRDNVERFSFIHKPIENWVDEYLEITEDGDEPIKITEENNIFFNDKSDIWALGIVQLNQLLDLVIFSYDWDFSDQIIENLKKEDKLKNPELSKDGRRSEAQYIYYVIKNYLHETNIDRFIDHIVGEEKKQIIGIEEFEMLKDVLKHMLDHSNGKRFNASQILDMPYFSPEPKCLCNEISITHRPYIASTLKIDIENKYEGLKYLIELIKHFLNDVDIIILFKSIDMYMRVINNTRESSLKFCKDIALSSIILTSLMYYRVTIQEKIKSAFLQKYLDSVDHEYYILNMLENKIDRTYVYEMSTSLVDLKYLYGHFKFPKGSRKRNPSFLGKMFLGDWRQEIFKSYLTFHLNEERCSNINAELISVLDFFIDELVRVKE